MRLKFAFATVLLSAVLGMTAAQKEASASALMGGGEGNCQGEGPKACYQGDTCGVGQSCQNTSCEVKNCPADDRETFQECHYCKPAA